jgi:hypothetical protein
VRAVIAVGLACACGRIGFGAQPLPDASISAPTPLGWWKLDDGSGGTAADSSGHGNAGTLSAGIARVAGRTTGAIDIDGVIDRDIDLGNPPLLQLTGTMTLAAWVRARTLHTGPFSFDNVIISRDDFGQSYFGWALKSSVDCANPPRFSLQIAADQNGGIAVCSVTLPLVGTWYHVAGVYDASAQQMHIYVNGVLDDGMLIGAAVPTAQYEPTSSVHVQIGNADPYPAPATSGGQNVFDGNIADVRIYDSALSAADIALLAR